MKSVGLNVIKDGRIRSIWTNSNVKYNVLFVFKAAGFSNIHKVAVKPMHISLCTSTDFKNRGNPPIYFGKKIHLALTVFWVFIFRISKWKIGKNISLHSALNEDWLLQTSAVIGKMTAFNLVFLLAQTLRYLFPFISVSLLSVWALWLLRSRWRQQHSTFGCT